MNNVDDYIGKRVFWETLEEHFPNHRIIYTGVQYNNSEDIGDISSATVIPLHICERGQRTAEVFDDLSAQYEELGTGATGEGELTVCLL